MKLKAPSVYDCSIIGVPTFEDPAGNISVVENRLNLPFDINRIFYIYDIPGGKDRGAHAHKKCDQFLVAVSGSFEIELDDGQNKRTVNLNRPYFGLYVPAGIWAAQKGFSSGSICLALTSHKFEESEYIRDYAEFKKFRKTEVAS